MKSKNKIEKKKINSYQSKEKPQPTGLNLSVRHKYMTD